jgi:hypothetical protein
LNPAEARRRRYLRHGEKMKDNEIGEIKGNASLKKMWLLIEWIYWIEKVDARGRKESL